MIENINSLLRVVLNNNRDFVLELLLYFITNIELSSYLKNVEGSISDLVIMSIQSFIRTYLTTTRNIRSIKDTKYILVRACIESDALSTLQRE